MSDAATSPKIDYKSLIKLDKKKAFGIVFPEEHGAHFDQNGLLFDQYGGLCDHLLKDEDRKRLEKMAHKKQADLAAERAKKAVYDKLGVSGESIEKELTPVAKHKPEPDDIDLVAWAHGAKVYPWAQVRHAAQIQYGIGESSIGSAEYLRVWMTENGYMQPPG
jgi:hypothetical protein